MILLGMDTSGPALSVALTVDGTLAQEVLLNVGLTHSETLMPAIDTVMRGTGHTMDEVDGFAVIAGPGSFTGVRIGVCAAKALAHASRVPKRCACINALTALAMAAPYANGVICPILDARRDQVYCAAYRFPSGARVPEAIRPDRAMAIDAFIADLPEDEPLYFSGDGLRTQSAYLLERLGARARLAPPPLRLLRASMACALAETLPPEAWCTPHELAPIYLRAPQAERERDARLTRQKVGE